MYVTVYVPCSGPVKIAGGISRFGIVITPVDESIVKRTFTLGTPGWLIVHTPPDGVPTLIIGDTLCGADKSNGHPIAPGMAFCRA